MKIFGTIDSLNTRSRYLWLVLLVILQLGLASYVLLSIRPPARRSILKFSSEEAPEPSREDVLTGIYKRMLLTDTQINASGWKVQPQLFQLLRQRRRKDIVGFASNSLADDSVVECLQGNNLRHLMLFTNHLTRRCLPIIFAMDQLQWLEFQSSSLHLTNDDLEELIKLKHLSSLRACGSNLTDERMRILSRHTFTRLDLPGNPFITDIGVACLANEPLKLLNLGGVNLTDRSAPVLSQIKSLEALTVSNTGVTDKSLAYFERMPNLRALDLRGDRITDIGLRAFNPAHPFKQLRIAGCKAISPEAVAEFQSRMPECKIEYNRRR